MTERGGKTDMTITEADLEWWLDLAPTLAFSEAKTMKDVPHSYVIADKTPGFSAEDCVRASRVIRAFGEPGKFYRYPNIYLYSRDRSVKWWLMSGPNTVGKNDLINQGPGDVFYGKQDLPPTGTLERNKYDTLSTEYDLMWLGESDLEENRRITSFIAKHFTQSAPKTLDVGCGTGLVLDQKITHPKLYTGVDPSQGMLNQLLLKHPDAANIHAGKFGDFEFGLRYDLVCALFASASYLTPEELRTMKSLIAVGGLGVWMTYEPGYLPDYYEEGEELPETFETSRAELFGWDDARHLKLGFFDVHVVRN